MLIIGFWGSLFRVITLSANLDVSGIKVIDPRQLNDLENQVAIVLCQMKMYFRPSFFDITVHLIVHLVREIQLCGPVFLRWMCPIEQYMRVLKGYTKNQYWQEVSIVERYVAEESIEFCS